MYYNFEMNKLNVTSLTLSPTLFNLLCLSCSKRLFLCLDSFILSLCVACLPVCVQKIVKQLRTQTLHTVIMEFPEIRSSILVHTISEMSSKCHCRVCLCLFQVINCIYINLTYPVSSHSMSNSIRC